MEVSMHTADYIAYSGKIMTFKPTDLPYGNVCHLYQGIRLTVMSGTFTGLFSQRMVQGASGVLENLSPEMTLNEQGQVQMNYPSETITLTLFAGQSVEIGPGCAYALRALSEASLLEVLLPEKYPLADCFKCLRDPLNLPLEDTIDFKLMENSTTDTAEKAPSSPPLEIEKQKKDTPEPETVKIQVTEPLFNLNALDKLHPKRQDILPSATEGFFYMGRMSALFIFAVALMAGTDSAFLDFILILVAFSSAYLLVAEIKKLGRFLPLISIIEDGLVISNRIYNQMPVLWSDIDALFLDTKSTFPNGSQLCLRIKLTKPVHSLDYMNPFTKQINLSQDRLLKEPHYPDVVISQSEITEDIQWLYSEIEKGMTAHRKATGH